MIIKQIKLNNFRQFKDEHIISFSTDKEKNVSVVLGSNTCGKTTIVGAFIWCLYGENTLKEPKMLLNKALEEKLTSYASKDVSVEVLLQHEGRDYIIYRTQRFYRSATGDGIRQNQPELRVSYIDEGGETNSVNTFDCQNVINSILPQALADYFFFDGERIKKINTKSNVIAAVRGLMGLDVYSSGMDHLDPKKANSVIGKMQKELDMGKDQEAIRKKGDIERYKIQLEGYERKKPEIEESIEHWETKKNDYAQIIKNNEDVKKAQELKEKLEKEEKYYANAIVTSENRLLSDFNNNACKFFALPLIKKAMSVLDSAKDEGEGIPKMHADSIEHIVQRGYCICGCDLTKNQGALEHVRYEQNLLPPQHIGTEIRDFKREMKTAISVSQMYADNVRQDYNNWLESQSQLENKQKELKEVSEKIKGQTNVKYIEEKYQEAVNQLNRYLTSKEGNKAGIIDLNARIAELERDIARLSATNDKNRKIMLYCDYAEAVYNWFKDYYDTSEKEVKKELLDSINDNFKKMYHGSRKIIMDENYKITPVSTDEGYDLAKSEGLETVTNFSFILGLVELARKKATVAEEEGKETDKVTEPYPIVMDAPFSNTDAEHIKNITARLPKVAEQVIVFVMDKDWDIAKERLQDFVGSQYVIEKVDNKDYDSILRREI